MNVRRFRSRLTLLGVIVVASCATTAPLVNPQATAPELSGFGVVQMTVTTSVPAARQWYLQGMQQAYAFNEREAVRSFKAALAQDAQCAACAWGVAWQLGPNINAVEREDLGEALRYALLAQDLAGNATPRERALIDAMVVRYADKSSAAGAGLPASDMCVSGGTGKAHPLDIAYALQLRVLADAYPDDPDVVSLYAEAEMVATRDDWWDPKTGKPAGRIGEVADRVERALAKNVDHTGLNHYLIHVVDAPGVAQRAVGAADRLGTLAPQAPHLVHMPSHTYVHVGRYADATRVSQAALSAQQDLNARLATLGFAQTKNWNGHNRHFLWFAALMQGRGDLALETARRLAAGAATSKSPWGEYQRGLPLLTLVRLGRWGDVLEETAGAGAADRTPAMYEYARGMAFVRTGRVAESAVLVVSLDERVRVARAAAKPDDDFAKSMAEMLATLSSQLKAEVALARGDVEVALAAGRDAIRAEEAMGGEPPMLGGGSQVALGDMLMRARRYPEAEAAFRADLAVQPGSGWALRGLQSAVAAQSRGAEAQQVQAELARAWKEADVALRPVPRS
jgi:tetratricopeptide (TPR) repeat protein